MTCYNQFILFIVCFLYTFSFFSALLIFGATFDQVLDKNYEKKPFFFFIQVMIFLVFPIKDLLIALSLSYMYFSQGKKVQRVTERERNETEEIFHIAETTEVRFDRQSDEYNNDNLRKNIQHQSFKHEIMEDKKFVPKNIKFVKDMDEEKINTLSI